MALNFLGAFVLRVITVSILLHVRDVSGTKGQQSSHGKKRPAWCGVDDMVYALVR